MLESAKAVPNLPIWTTSNGGSGRARRSRHRRRCNTRPPCFSLVLILRTISRIEPNLLGRRFRLKVRTAGAAHSGRDVIFPRTATRPLARQHHSPVQDLPAPHTPRFGALQCGRQAGPANRASRAQRLGAFQIGRTLGEPQVGVCGVARQKEWIGPVAG
jgi:hypothetical protein